MEVEDVEKGILRICGEPIDVHQNGTGMCMKHYLSMMQPVIKQAGASFKLMRNQEDTPPFGVDTPSYLK